MICIENTISKNKMSSHVYKNKRLKKLCVSFLITSVKLHQTVTKYLGHKCPWICIICCNHNPTISSIMTYHWMFDNSNTTGTTGGPGTVYPSRTLEFTLFFLWISSCLIFSFLYSVLKSFRMVVGCITTYAISNYHY